MKIKSRLRRLAWLARFSMWSACVRGGALARQAWLYVCVTFFSLVAFFFAHRFFDPPGLPSVKATLIAFFFAIIPGVLVAMRFQRVNVALDAFAASSQSRAQISLGQARALAEASEIERGCQPGRKRAKSPRL